MAKLGNLFIALLVLSAFFWLVESVFAANPRQPRLLRRRGIGTDVVYWFATPLLTKTISQIGLAIILMLIYREDVAGIRAMLASRDTLLAGQPLWLQALEMVAVGDFIGYWTHRWFHGRTMWKFHAIHHSSQDLDWLSAVRLHPVNDWLSRWIQASALVLLGFAPAAIAAYVPFLTLYAIFIHANVSWGFGKLGVLVASPKFHRWHHTSEDEGLDKNFAGLLPLFDVLFGTYYMPEGRLPERFGLKNEDVPTGLLGQLAYPFRRAAPVPALEQPASASDSACRRRRG
jgi:sterol desaturase/sphingolipid hydroxylase (fatty acid hydroxylase superfamily)